MSRETKSLEPIFALARITREPRAGMNPPLQSRLLSLSGFSANCRSPWIYCCLLVLGGTLTHLPALQGEFIWDDDFLARNNPFIKSPLLILETFRHYLFIDSSSPHYRPVQNLSYCLDYILWHTNPWGFHLTNLLLHLASGVLLYFLLRRLLRPLIANHICEMPSDASGLQSTKEAAAVPGIAFFVAMLWMVHPVHSAAVDYISGRADSLAFLFSCGAWLLVFRARDSSRQPIRVAFYIIAGLSGLIALCSREIAGVWFALFLLYSLLFEHNSRQFKLVSLICCLCLLATYVGLRQLPPTRITAPPSEHWNASTRAVLMLRAMGDYARLLVWPTNLHMERTVVNSSNYISHASWRDSVAAEYLSLLGAVTVVALLVACRARGFTQRVRILGASWFVIAFLPVSNLIMLNATVAEHWLYLPSVGFILFCSGCALQFFGVWRKALVTAASCAVIALAVRAGERSSDWQSAEVFYARTLQAGGVTPRIRLNFAHCLAKRGEYAKAEEILRRLLAFDPEYVIARNNLADVLSHQGKTDEAQKILSSATRLALDTPNQAPRTWVAALNLARFYHQRKNDRAALDVLEKARAEYPDTWELISCESELRRQISGPSAALSLVEKFAEKNWWHYEAALALGRLYAEKGDAKRAEKALQRAAWLDFHDAASLNLIAQICVRQNRFDDARSVQLRAISREPDEPRQYAILSDILEKMGRTGEAQAAIQKASALRELALNR